MGGIGLCNGLKFDLMLAKILKLGYLLRIRYEE